MHRIVFGYLKMFLQHGYKYGIRNSTFFLHTTRALVVSFCILGTLPAEAQLSEAVRLLDTGNQYYTDGVYDKALTAYHASLSQGYVSGELYYNMGNAYYRIDAMGQAIRYYEKARRLIGDHPHLLHNMQIVRSRTQQPFSALPVPFWESNWQKYVARHGTGKIFAAGAFLYVIATLLLAHRLWTRPSNPWHRRALQAAGIGSILLLSAAFGVSAENAARHQVVVIEKETVLQAMPNDATGENIIIPEGIVLDVILSDGNWLDVRLPNGVQGKINAEAVGDI